MVWWCGLLADVPYCGPALWAASPFGEAIFVGWVL